METAISDAGFDLRPAPWKPPAAVGEDLRREATQAVADIRALSALASLAQVERLVAHLANLCAGRDLPPESKLMGVSSAMLRAGYPVAIIDNADVLDRLARKFTWWPGWAELAPALDAERDALRRRYERLVLIAKAPATPSKSPPVAPVPAATTEQAAAVRAMLAAAGVAPKEFDPPPAAVADGPVKRVAGDWGDTRQTADDSTSAAIARTQAALQGFRKIERKPFVGVASVAQP